MNGTPQRKAADAAFIEKARTGGASGKAVTELVRDITPLILSRARGFSSDEEDVKEFFQEGMIGFVYALRTWREDAGASFTSYACLCAVNRMKNLYKRRVLPNGVSLVSIDGSETEIPDPDEGAAGLQESEEQLEILQRAITEKLSPLEKSVLDDYLAGNSYNETAKHLGVTPKAVDNAVQRIRRKLAEFRP